MRAYAATRVRASGNPNLRNYVSTGLRGYVAPYREVGEDAGWLAD